MRKLFSIILILALCLAVFAGCGEQQTATDQGNPGQQSTPTPIPTPAGNISSNDEDDTTIIKCDSWMATITKFDKKGEEDEVDTRIVLNDANTTIEGQGVILKDGYVVIGAEGTYSLSGTLTNGGIIVDVPVTDKVHLILNGVNITSNQYAAICVIAGDKVSITLADGTVNKLTDSTAYTYVYSETVVPNACLFSKETLIINGTGSLEVYGNCNNGITSKDHLKILGGNIYVNAVNHGVRGNDSVLINGGSLSIYAANDGIKATNETDSIKGFVFLTGGTINVRAADDAVQAITAVYITDAIAEVACGGKAINCDGTVWTKDGSFTEVDYMSAGDMAR